MLLNMSTKEKVYNTINKTVKIMETLGQWLKWMCKMLMCYH